MEWQMELDRRFISGFDNTAVLARVAAITAHQSFACWWVKH